MSDCTLGLLSVDRLWYASNQKLRVRHWDQPGWSIIEGRLMCFFQVSLRFQDLMKLFHSASQKSTSWSSESRSVTDALHSRPFWWTDSSCTGSASCSGCDLCGTCFSHWRVLRRSSDQNWINFNFIWFQVQCVQHRSFLAVSNRYSGVPEWFPGSSDGSEVQINCTGVVQVLDEGVETRSAENRSIKCKSLRNVLQ